MALKPIEMLVCDFDDQRHTDRDLPGGHDRPESAARCVRGDTHRLGRQGWCTTEGTPSWIYSAQDQEDQYWQDRDYSEADAKMGKRAMPTLRLLRPPRCSRWRRARLHTPRRTVA
jgi:hypothetical protein